jgi:hypothetical protein
MSNYLFDALLFFQHNSLVVLAHGKRVQFIGSFGRRRLTILPRRCLVILSLFSARQHAARIAQPRHKPGGLVHEQRDGAAAGASAGSGRVAGRRRGGRRCQHPSCLHVLRGGRSREVLLSARECSGKERRRWKRAAKMEKSGEEADGRT